MKKNVRFVTIVGLLVLTFALTACGGGNVPAPTQTPQYVIITDTPDITATPDPDEDEADVDADSDEPVAEDDLESAQVTVPEAFMCKAEVIEQTYENGYMFWVGATTQERCKTSHDFVPGTGEIWVAILDETGQVGDWLIFPDEWVEGEDPEADPDLEPPNDELRQPTRGFGYIWRENLTEEQRDDIGWATGDEFKFTTDYRYDTGGFLNDDGEFVPRPGIHRLLALGGEQFFFDESSKTAFFIGN